MSNSVDNAHVQQFTSSVMHLAQQKGSKLRGTVTNDTITGKFKHYDRLGVGEVTEVTTRHTPTPLSDLPHSRRRVILKDFIRAEGVDSEDLLRMLTDPTSDYAKALGMAMGREMDRRIIAALEGNATAIDASDTASSVALVHTVDEDFNTANSDIIVEKVIEAKRIMLANEVDTSSGLYFVQDSTALHNMIQQTEVSSFDYNSVKALVNGDINTFMGFNFIQTELLSTTSEGFKNCLAYTKDSCKFAIAQDIKTSVDKRADLSNMMQILVKGSFNAVRMAEESVVAVEAYRA